jgi:hypothetical protein
MASSPLRRLPLLLITTLCLAGVARAQTGGARVTASGGVSQIVTLSFDQGAKVSPEGVGVASSNNEGRALVITISGTARDLTRVRIPIRIRSNTAYRLLATAKSDGAKLVGLSVVDARPTGKLVAADAEVLGVSRMFDARLVAGTLFPADGFNRPNPSSLLELLSGPRVSLGGTLGSPLNALEVTLSMAVEPRAGAQVWTIELLLSAAPTAPF